MLYVLYKFQYNIIISVFYHITKNLEQRGFTIENLIINVTLWNKYRCERLFDDSECFIYQP